MGEEGNNFYEITASQETCFKIAQVIREKYIQLESEIANQSSVKTPSLIESKIIEINILSSDYTSLLDHFFDVTHDDIDRELIHIGSDHEEVKGEEAYAYFFGDFDRKKMNERTVKRLGNQIQFISKPSIVGGKVYDGYIFCSFLMEDHDRTLRLSFKK